MANVGTMNGFFFRSLILAWSFALAMQGPEPPKATLLGLHAMRGATVTTSSTDGSVSELDSGGTNVLLKPGKDDYPGVTLTAPGAGWDLSKYGHVEARVKNLGAKPLTVSLRVDNAGDWRDNPWDAESVTLAAGQAGTVEVIFGYSYGFKPGFRLNPGAVPRVLLFAGKSAEPQSFEIESIVAAGPAGEKPAVAADDVRIRLPGGTFPNSEIMLDAGNAGGRGDIFVHPLRFRLRFRAGTEYAIKPRIGRWDLREFDEVRLVVANEGKTQATPKVRLESNGCASDWVSATLGPGKSAELVVLFGGRTPYDVTSKTGGGQITNDAVAAIRIASDPGSVVVVKDLHAAASPATPPTWLGQRPPVPGDWIKTLDEEFEGTTLDRSVWRDVGENYYDKVSHWSKANAILGGGVMRLRFEKKRGFQNDDPKRNETPYAVGFLDTYGLWKQRYGYFEARMKIPSAPGLWPAFWMMPDRGVGEQWQRQDTANGGMEFDIMENLTRWGTRRYNIAMHYDGYAQDHKAVGSEKNYVRPDKDGFLTCGLLWTPGSAVFYCNGQEILYWENPRISNVPSILMFTLPSGGWDNDALDDTKLPADFVIDYVRVWQRRDLASPVDGKVKGR